MRNAKYNLTDEQYNTMYQHYLAVLKAFEGGDELIKKMEANIAKRRATHPAHVF